MLASGEFTAQKWSLSVKVGDIVLLKEEYQIKYVYYGPGVITSITDYPEEGFVSHRVHWNDDFSFHGTEELELISESR